MTLKMLAVIAALALVPTGAVYAQHKHSHSHAEKGRNGGRIVDAGDYHVELVAKSGALEVYVTDHDDKPVAVKGYKGIAILSVDGKSQRIALEVADDAKLTGKATGNLPAQPKGVVQIIPPNGKTVSAKF
jgi:hypothetical protein